MADFAVTARVRASFIVAAQNREEAEKVVKELVENNVKLVAPGKERLRDFVAEDFRALNISVL